MLLNVKIRILLKNRGQHLLFYFDSKCFILASLTHSQAGDRNILISFTCSTDKTKKLRHTEKCVCYLYSQGLSKLDLFANMGLLL